MDLPRMTTWLILATTGKAATIIQGSIVHSCGDGLGLPVKNKSFCELKEKRLADFQKRLKTRKLVLDAPTEGAVLYPQAFAIITWKSVAVRWLYNSSHWRSWPVSSGGVEASSVGQECNRRRWSGHKYLQHVRPWIQTYPQQSYGSE